MTGPSKDGPFSADEWQAFLDDIDHAEDKDSQGEKAELSGDQTKRVATQGEYALEIDLHGQSLEEAKKTVLRGYDHASSYGHKTVLLRIITGKGKHSGVGGAILPVEIYDFVCNQLKSAILSIDESPSEAKIGGLPIKGYFDVRLSAR